MSDADKYRASARDCLCKAEKAFYPEDKQAWMDMAETRLEMIPAPERTPEACYRLSERLAVLFLAEIRFGCRETRFYEAETRATKPTPEVLPIACRD